MGKLNPEEEARLKQLFSNSYQDEPVPPQNPVEDLIHGEEFLALRRRIRQEMDGHTIQEAIAIATDLLGMATPWRQGNETIVPRQLYLIGFAFLRSLLQSGYRSEEVLGILIVTLMGTLGADAAARRNEGERRDRGGE